MMMMMKLAAIALLILVAAGRGTTREIRGHHSLAFSHAGHVLPSMQEFCEGGNESIDGRLLESDSNVARSRSCIEEPLRLAVWNMQRFGRAKINQEEVVEVIVEVIHNYDLIVLQEVTDASGTAIPALIVRINEGLASSDQYAVVQSPRIGRTSYKEQYVFIYKKERMTYVRGYKFDDQTDIFQTEPFLAQFHTQETGQLQDFVVIPLHAKPSDAVKELDALVDVYDEMVLKFNITDAVLLGDFNAGCNYVVQGEYEQIRLYTDQRFHWLISDHADTTTKSTSCPYDRILVAGEKMQDATYYKTATTYYFDEDLGIESKWDLVKAVSDHYPVGVMIRGSIPEAVYGSYHQHSFARSARLFTEPDSDPSPRKLDIRVGVTVELPVQGCWGEVMALVHGLDRTGQPDHCSQLSNSDHQSPSVTVVSNVALVVWESSSVHDALSTLIQLAERHPHLVTTEAVSVLGYKAGHGVLTDHTLYLAKIDPQDVRLTFLCHTLDNLIHCTIALSAATDIN